MKTLLTCACLVILAVLISCGGDTEDPGIDCSMSNLAVTVLSQTDADCDSPGSVTLVSSGGEGTITYSIDGSNFQSSASFDASAGNYTATAKDGNGCTATVSLTIGADDNTVVITSVNVTSDAGCGSSNGALEIIASGGDGSYSYSVDGGVSFVSTNMFSGLEAGTVNVAVKDGDGCEDDDIEEILSGISLSSDIMPIITANCAISSCHVPGTAREDLSTASGVISNASSVNSRVQSGSMPPSGSLSQANMDLIECWFNDGGLNN